MPAAVDYLTMIEGIALASKSSGKMSSDVAAHVPPGPHICGLQTLLCSQIVAAE